MTKWLATIEKKKKKTDSVCKKQEVHFDPDWFPHVFKRNPFLGFENIKPLGPKTSIYLS
jgi:hypothetical protein